MIEKRAAIAALFVLLHGSTSYNGYLAGNAVKFSCSKDVYKRQQLICQCCGMPLEDSITSKEPDGSFNEDYCMWCYADGTFKYPTKEQLIDFCVTHMATESWPAEQVRAHMEAIVPTLKHWKK